MKKLVGNKEQDVIELFKTDMILLEKKIVLLEKIVESMSNNILPMFIEWKKEKDEQDKEVRGMLYG